MSALRQYLDATFEGELLLLDPPEVFDACILGVAERACSAPTLVYDRACVIEALVRGGMTHEKAEEHFSYNVAGGWHGEATPLFLEKIDAAS